MPSTPMLLTLLPLLPSLTSPTHVHPSNNTYLTAPALVTINNRTVIQCWRLTNQFVTSSTPGTVGAQAVVVSNVTNLAYTILPPRFNGGKHNAPVPQLVHFVSGLAHITLPHDFSQNDDDSQNDESQNDDESQTSDDNRNNEASHDARYDEHTDQDLWLPGGKGGLVFAADTTGTGHVTVYPSDQETVGIVAPFEGGEVPEHEVLGEGPCEGVQTFV